MPIKDEVNTLNIRILNVLSDLNCNISDEIKDYLSSKSKRLRPSLIFLFAKALNIKITDEIYYIACAVELIHNSTLIHDDIIDEAKIRRGKISLNAKLGNSLSVLAGDILITLGLKQLISLNNNKIINIFTESLYKMCKGEINQLYTKGKIPTVEDYIKKSENKTAELFKSALVSLFYISDINEIKKITDFAKNFGIAFQIRDDLINIIGSDNKKPLLNDIKSGIYTAPVIYLNEDENINSLSEEKIIQLVQNKKYIEKTYNLIKYYTEKAIKSIDFIQENQYKQKITEITLNLYKEVMNE